MLLLLLLLLPLQIVFLRIGRLTVRCRHARLPHPTMHDDNPVGKDFITPVYCSASSFVTGASRILCIVLLAFFIANVLQIKTPICTGLGQNLVALWSQLSQRRGTDWWDFWIHRGDSPQSQFFIYKKYYYFYSIIIIVIISIISIIIIIINTIIVIIIIIISISIFIFNVIKTITVSIPFTITMLLLLLLLPPLLFVFLPDLQTNTTRKMNSYHL